MGERLGGVNAAISGGNILEGIAGGAITGAVVSAVVYGGMRAFKSISEQGMMTPQEAAAREQARTMLADGGTVASDADPGLLSRAADALKTAGEAVDNFFSKETFGKAVQYISHADKAAAVLTTQFVGGVKIYAGVVVFSAAPPVGAYLILSGVAIEGASVFMAYEFWWPKSEVQIPLEQHYGP